MTNSNQDFEWIIEKLPYGEPFLFVDTITEITDTYIIGTYTFKKESYFYSGHFPGKPITPGVILTECAAQIGLVCFGLYTLGPDVPDLSFAFTQSQMDFYKPVQPGETIRVRGEKVYFRFSKLKCNVVLYNKSNETVARGCLSGMISNERKV